MDQIDCIPYMFFRGNCKEAMEFYQSVFGGKLFLQTYKEGNMVSQDNTQEQIMHAGLSEGLVHLMASDTAKASEAAKKVAISLSGEDEELLRKVFADLSEGVEPQFPLEESSWGDIFGSLVDKYGIEWMVNISIKKDNA